ncbi:haloacid dehalogenase superfamily%2C subfamily IA%2C variant 3 with third motif having DD or ED [Clostridium baratii]|uniref:HAD family hydrolase n=1 Tax=Clostridium baratii TaxID=1561 RepID=UPI0006C731C6|nr:HAD family phosphatase [Clostridium baratii]CUO91402.1 haloacid dehalogenase superfamily%2C subfamily IA%2C variant 3 with third motif having DD or ED [Clostridium baratii]
MIKAVIFDLDGLLIDSEIISYKIYKEILNQFGHDFSMEEYAQNFSGKTEVKNVTNLIDKYSLPWTVEIGLNNVLEIESKFLAQGVTLKTGAKELLEYLKDKCFKIAIASSSTEDRALTILRQHNIIEYFDEFVFGHEVKKGKPNPDIFLKACDKLLERPEECLVLEDSEAGIQAAYSASIPVICIPDMKVPNQHYLDMTKTVLHSLEEVIAYL